MSRAAHAQDRLVAPQRRLNNDADAGVSQGPQHGKSRNPLPHCNRAEHPARTTTQICSRLRDARQRRRRNRVRRGAMRRRIEAAVAWLIGDDARAERDRPVMAWAAAGRMLDWGLAGYESFRRRILGMLRKSAPCRFAVWQNLHGRREPSCDAAWRALGWFDPIK
jgi:hypothetical protein